jgi:thiamine kinase-like enzyme
MSDAQPPIDDELRAIFLLIPALRGWELIVTKLPGGLTNRNYRVTAGDESYVLRIAGADSSKLGIDRAREITALRTAAAAGIGPELTAHLPEANVLLVRFVKGQKFQAGDMRQAATLRDVARSLRRYHDHPVPDGLASFCPFEATRGYFRATQEANLQLPEELGRTLDTLDRIETELETDEPNCLCHNDLLAGNFIDDGSTLRIIDWEYAGLGDRFFDLGNFAAHAQLSEDEEALLAESYFDEARPDRLRRLRLMRLVSDLRESTWGYLQSHISNLHPPQHYRDYGDRFLQRFRAAPITRELTAP